MARPRTKLDEKLIVSYARAGCSDRDIGAMFDVAHTTIARRFAWQLAKARSERRTLLRQKQWNVASDPMHPGHTTMLIFLGKAELEQRDRDPVKVELSGKNGGPIETKTTKVVKHTIDYDELARDLDRFAAERAAAGADGRISAYRDRESMDSGDAYAAAETLPLADADP